MSTDLFNNISNNYINPALASCAGNSDTYTFEFLPNQQVGVVSGSSIITAMGLGDISRAVEGWDQQTKLLQPGEVIFIQGLTKGISNKIQYFPFDASVVYTGTNHSLYMDVDISINYYKNFKYYDINMHVESDATEDVAIDTAFNIAFDGLSIGVSASYDSSGLTFTGATAGYSFDITAVDVSLGDPSASTGYASLVEDISLGTPAFKYPNGAMLGYVLKVTYPSTAIDSDSYIEINHVPDYLVYFEPSTGDPNSYIRYYKAVDVGLSGTSCIGDTLSAADYLDYVETNNKWEKVGVLRMWLTAVDPTSSSTENLITGFYVHNPQSLAVKLDYITIL